QAAGGSAVGVRGERREAGRKPGWVTKTEAPKAESKAERLDQPRARSARDQYDPHAFHRCSPAGEVRPSGHADGARAAGLRDLERGHALRSTGPDLAKSRSLRLIKRPRFYAAVVRVISRRNARGKRAIRASRRARGHPRRYWPFPSTRYQSARASRISLGLGR